MIVIDFYQAWIVVFAGLAVFVLAQKNPLIRKWGYVLGLISQPAWFMTIKENQWGILIMCIWCTFSYALGVYNYFIKPQNKR